MKFLLGLIPNMCLQNPFNDGSIYQNEQDKVLKAAVAFYKECLKIRVKNMSC